MTEDDDGGSWSIPALLGAHFAGISACAFSPFLTVAAKGRPKKGETCVDDTDHAREKKLRIFSLNRRPANLVTGSDDKTVIVWCLELGVRLATFVTDGEVRCCTVDVLGGWACGDTTGKLYLLTVEKIAPGAHG